MNVIKLTPETLSSIFEELAKGEQSIKAILKDKNITYECLRKTLSKRHANGAAPGPAAGSLWCMAINSMCGNPNIGSFFRMSRL